MTLWCHFPSSIDFESICHVIITSWNRDFTNDGQWRTMVSLFYHNLTSSQRQQGLTIQSKYYARFGDATKPRVSFQEIYYVNLKAQKKGVCLAWRSVSCDMPKTTRVGRSENCFYFFSFFLFSQRVFQIAMGQINLLLY